MLDNNFENMTNQNVATTKISFQISKEIASAGKSYTESVFVKKYILSSVRELCLQNFDIFQNIS